MKSHVCCRSKWVD